MQNALSPLELQKGEERVLSSLEKKHALKFWQEGGYKWNQFNYSCLSKQTSSIKVQVILFFVNQIPPSFLRQTLLSYDLSIIFGWAPFDNIPKQL